MLASQEPKYKLNRRGNSYCWQNRASGRDIPDYEPVFVLRGSDPAAIHVLLKYSALLRTSRDRSSAGNAHEAAVIKRVREFRDFLECFSEQMSNSWLPLYSSSTSKDLSISLFGKKADPRLASERARATHHHGEADTAQGDEPIPDHEPLFLFRARDINARHAIEFYTQVTQSPEREECAKITLAAFNAFSLDKPLLMKSPDTDDAPSP